MGQTQPHQNRKETLSNILKSEVRNENNNRHRCRRFACRICNNGDSH